MENLTNKQGAFAQAMSQITRDPSSASQGSFCSQNYLNKKLFDQIQLALAVQLGINGPQQVKERALHNVLTSNAARGDMKQILQSRAEIYGDELDPNWFKQKVDLGGNKLEPSLPERLYWWGKYECWSSDRRC